MSPAELRALERAIPDVVVVECTGDWAEEWRDILEDLAALWTGATLTPAGELFPVLIASIVDRRSN